ncbi:MAG TPA: helix-turn-helix transcriptional regulator [Candidatus Borkfalkia excrementavium]|uniref:Helix-turn-helix transcriptional regulator n=1 Tax=Candidatus Borkfalkia excrementavium TaxID=2838505 RepID=A0A9D1Z7I2_9FIRM|nr:helix-turn-helix transcriptional regulator [Candidatus Borkfalkia excrementavium]
MTQEELAEALGCSQAMIARWEANEHQPKEEHIVKAAKFFGVSTDYILGLSDY